MTISDPISHLHAVTRSATELHEHLAPILAARALRANME